MHNTNQLASYEIINIYGTSTIDKNISPLLEDFGRSGGGGGAVG